ncbi:MAG: DUF1858 domain-containing protein [Candidatus Marinimicrobia bacterium]|nr:DUF1858 domain-containing protein [Candidatus Neomarinimicrobiota bacterium]
MIYGNIYIEDLIHDYPQVISPLAELGIICIACGEPVWGTLEELVNKKGLNNLDEILEKLNKIIDNNENTQLA